MKTFHSILLVASFGLLAACSNTTSEPNPTSSAPAAPAAAQTVAPTVRTPRDVVPTKLFARVVAGLPAAKLVQMSMPLNPMEKLPTFDVEPVVTSDLMDLHPKGAAESVHEIAIDSTDGEATLFLAPKVDDEMSIRAALADVQVLDPDGVVVNVRKPKPGVDPSKAPPMTMIPLAGHKPGVYKVVVKGRAAATGLAIEARQPLSHVTMTITPSSAEYLLGNTATVDVVLKDGATPITGAKLTSGLLDEQMNKGGGVTFSEVGGGVYRATITGLTESSPVGAYLTDVRAEGTTPSGARFLRQGRAGFHFGVPTARLGQVTATREIKDSDGMITAFEVDVPLDAAATDRLEVSGTLTVVGSDGDEHTLAIAHTGDTYDAGHHVVTLRFDAGQVRLTKMEGDFSVRNLQVFSVGTNTLMNRLGAGVQRPFVGIRRDHLVRLAKPTPAVQQLIADHVLYAD